jgi:hypothetical protein
MIIGFILTLCLSAFAEDGNFLNVFILTSPAKYLSDIPNNQRDKLILFVSNPTGNRMLDYANGWLSYFCDNPYEDLTSSMFWIKLLPRKNDNPLVFVYMAKPLASGGTPANNQTYILDRDGNDWQDVTARFMPKDVDMTMSFVPRRTGEDIQVAGYRKVPSVTNPKGEAYNELGACRLVLHWNGTSFEKRPVKPRKVDYDY